MCNLSKNRRKILILDIIIILCWMGIVFTFSNQIGKTSTNLSSSIASRLVDIIHRNDTELTVKERTRLINKYNYNIRKLAHYSIYLVGGIIIFSFVHSLLDKKVKAAIISILLGFLYACSDELHQFFISGRDATFRDVLIDTAGVITGVAIYLAMIAIVKKIKKKNNIDINDKIKESI